MKASGYDRASNDWYVEPRWLVDALLDVETFEGLSWDPACGSGTIPTAVAARGDRVMGSDIVDRCGGFYEVIDFLTVMPRDGRIANIISNPPYGVIQPFVERALAIATHKVAILARLAFLEGQERRDTLFAKHPISRVWVSSRRPSMPPGGTDVPAKGGSIAFAWFVWDSAHAGPTILGHLGNGEPLAGSAHCDAVERVEVAHVE